MYAIYADNTCIYSDTSNDLSLKLTSATLSLEDNTAGSLQFTMPITNAGYNLIQRMYTHVTVYRDNEKIWGGRPLSESTDFYKNKTVFCEGELAYLNDTYQPVAEYHDLNLNQFLQCILQVHNNKCNGDEDYTDYSNGPPEEAVLRSNISTFDFYPSTNSSSSSSGSSGSGSSVPGIDNSNVTSIGHRDKRIYLGTVTVYDDYGDDYRCTSYETTLDTIQAVVNNYGGHLRVRTGNDGKLYLDYFKDYLNRSNQVINFGHNLLDYTKDFDMSNLCTVLLPLGAKKDESDLVGDPISTHWNRCSILTSEGKVRYGKNFFVTAIFPVSNQSTYYEYNSSNNSYTEKTYNNRLKLRSEQLNGYVSYAFYRRNVLTQSGFELLSATTASGSSGSKIYYDATISIPSDAEGVAFGYYYDGVGCNTHFQAQYTTYETSVIWTEFSTDDTLNSVTYIEGNHIIDPNTGSRTGRAAGEEYVVSDPIPAEEKEVFYITSRQDGGNGMYCAFLKDGRPLSSVSCAGSGVGFTDWEKNKVECPVGTAYIIVAGKTGAEMNPEVFGDYRAQTTGYTPPDEYVTIESVNNGSLYLKSNSLIATYGWIERQITWDEMTTPADLLARAQIYMRDTQFDEMVLQIKAFDLHLISSTEDAIDILDRVQCISSPHGLNKTLPVTKIEIPILEPQNATFTLGEERQMGSLTESHIDAESDIFTRIGEIPTPSSILLSAKANATSLINQRTNGHVVVSPDEILIMDAPDKSSATRLWRMNVNGIGYSNEGYAGTFGLAFTMDGSIVADRITTGYLHADRIRGGTLTLGGYDNVNGEFYMKNHEGRNFVKMTKDGTEMIAKISQVVKWGEASAGTGGGIIPKYGVIELNEGTLTGYTAEIKTKLDSTEAQNANWWKTYSFSFDDITSKTAKTSISLMNPSKTGISSGIDIHSANYFSLWLDSPGDYGQYVPHIELGTYTSGNSTSYAGAFIIGRSGGSYVGLYYNGETTPFTSGEGHSFYNDNKTTNRTLVIRNDNAPSGSPNGFNNGLGYGGVYILSDGSPVSVEGTGINLYSASKSIKGLGSRVFLKGDDVSITKGNLLLTGASGRIPIVTKIESSGNGGVTWWYDYITVNNGFITGFPAGSTASTGSYYWPGFESEGTQQSTITVYNYDGTVSGGGNSGGFTGGDGNFTSGTVNGTILYL